MKQKLSAVILLVLALLLTACHQETVVPPEPTHTAEIIVETVVVQVMVQETVVVVATPTTGLAQVAPIQTPTTAVAQVTPTVVPIMTPTSAPSATATRAAVATTRPTAVPPTAVAGPTILYFRANVAIADPGQTVVLDWSSTGATQAVIGHLFDFRLYPDVSELPTSGIYNYPIRDSQRNSITLYLTVIDAEDRWAMESNN